VRKLIEIRMVYKAEIPLNSEVVPLAKCEGIHGNPKRYQHCKM